MSSVPLCIRCGRHPAVNAAAALCGMCLTELRPTLEAIAQYEPTLSPFEYRQEMGTFFGPEWQAYHWEGCGKGIDVRDVPSLSERRGMYFIAHDADRNPTSAIQLWWSRVLLVGRHMFIEALWRPPWTGFRLAIHSIPADATTDDRDAIWRGLKLFGVLHRGGMPAGPLLIKDADTFRRLYFECQAETSKRVTYEVFADWLTNTRDFPIAARTLKTYPKKLGVAWPPTP